MNKKISKRQIAILGGATALSLLMGVPAFASTSSTTATQTGTHSSTKTSKNTYAHVRTILTHAAFGIVASVNGSTFTITHKTKTGTVTSTMTTTSTTTFKKNGKADTANDLAVGQRVVVMGTKDSLGNIADATSVNIMVRTPRVASSTKSS